MAQHIREGSGGNSLLNLKSQYISDLTALTLDTHLSTRVVNSSSSWRGGGEGSGGISLLNTYRGVLSGLGLYTSPKSR